VPLIEAGVDAFWPDEGDRFSIYERMTRVKMYYQGHLMTTPNVRPWTLNRNGVIGMARWGAWLWSGDTQSRWDIDENVLFHPGPAAIGGVLATALDTAEGSRETAVDSAARPVDLARLVEVFEQDLVELGPNALLLPGVQAAPASHATAATHLGGQVFPRDARLEDEEDASQSLAVVYGLTSGVAEAALLGRR
jgi:hypothetical protein